MANSSPGHELADSAVSKERQLEVSHDVPSAPGVRPFGLTCTTPVPEEQIVVIAGMRYDPTRQITVDADGVPAVHPTGRRHPTPSPHITIEDRQSWPDYRVAEVPADVRQGVTALLKHLGLVYTALDLIVDDRGRGVFAGDVKGEWPMGVGPPVA